MTIKTFKKKKIPKKFPFREIFIEFFEEYSKCTTYWYVPKTRTLNDENIKAIQDILTTIIDDFLGHIWNPHTQSEILRKLTEKGILEPYKPEGTLQDRTALIRIWKRLLEALGLIWIQDNKEIIFTDAGLDVISKDPRPVIENQIAKIQYPNPSQKRRYKGGFKSILPHLFLLQVLKECDYKISFQEYELFVNLSQDHEDLSRIVNYIKCWRDLDNDEKKIVLKLVKDIPMSEENRQSKMFPYKENKVKRYKLINQSSSYQRAIFTYPNYLDLTEDENGSFIYCKNQNQINQLLKEKLGDLKITLFSSLEDWFAYFGDPTQKPSWFTYLFTEIDRASTAEEASKLVEKHKSRLTTEGEQQEILKKKIEKDIEDFYVKNLYSIESGLTLIKDGRQYSTPIGRIDLLCKSKEGDYVIIEIKANEADDSSFGQILRYIGWVYRNKATGKKNVRGILLAGRFPETARYSRIGLLKDGYKEFLKFKKHGLDLSDS